MISKTTEGFYWDKAFLEKSANELNNELSSLLL